MNNGKKKDFYAKRAKKENYPARSIYKLQEADKKYGLIKNGDRVLDLGCSPGSWLIYLSEKVGQNGKILGIDENGLRIPVPKNAVFLKKDIFDLEDSDFADFGRFDVIVSDLAPKTSGMKFADSGRSLELCEKAFEITEKLLVLKGNFFCKIFENAGTPDFFEKIRKKFGFAKRFKPKSSRPESKEIFIIARAYLAE